MVLLDDAGWPVISDDTGNGTSGTEVDKAWADGVKDAIDSLTNDPANPTVTPADIIGEVIDARGSKATLDARLDVALNEDGTLKTSGSGVATETQLQSAIGNMNLIGNDTFLIWPEGDSSAPSYFALTGAGAAVARCGSGLADTKRKVGKFCAKITYGSAEAKMTQVLLDSGVFDDYFYGKTFGFGCWLWSSTASIGSLIIDDGVASPTRSSYHTGDSTWQWISGTHTMRNSSTKLEMVLSVAGAGSVYFSGPTLIMSAIAPSGWVPTPKVYGSVVFPLPGTPTTGTDKGAFAPARPGLIKDVQVRAKTAGTQLTIDVNTWDGTSAWESIFATALSLGTGNYAGKQPDNTTYARRCLAGSFGSSTPGKRGMLNYDVDTVTGTPADAMLHIRILQYSRPLEDFLDYND